MKMEGQIVREKPKRKNTVRESGGVRRLGSHKKILRGCLYRCSTRCVLKDEDRLRCVALKRRENAELQTFRTRVRAKDIAYEKKKFLNGRRT
jgi:hypothetical protein